MSHQEHMYLHLPTIQIQCTSQLLWDRGLHIQHWTLPSFGIIEGTWYVAIHQLTKQCTSCLDNYTHTDVVSVTLANNLNVYCVQM